MKLDKASKHNNTRMMELVLETDSPIIPGIDGSSFGKEKIKLACGEILTPVLQCVSHAFYTFIFNVHNGRFTKSYGAGYVLSELGNPSITISYGTCDKFD